MKHYSIKKTLSFIGCVLLITAMALYFTGCTSKAEPNSSSAASATFRLVVTDPEGKETSFDISTDKETVGEALLEKGLISGEDSEFGLFVTTVNGITLDWEKDQKYWAFYIDGEYAATGVDATPITQGATYSFKAE